MCAGGYGYDPIPLKNVHPGPGALKQQLITYDLHSLEVSATLPGCNRHELANNYPSCHQTSENTVPIFLGKDFQEDASGESSQLLKCFEIDLDNMWTLLKPLLVYQQS